MPIALVSSSDEKNWHRERDRRVTKTRATQLVGAGIATFKRLDAETGGSFGGNAATKRGHRLEPVVQQWVQAHLGIPPCGILFAHELTPMHAATPDCALEDEGEWSIAEIKTTVEDWSRGLPKKIIRDALWQKYVMDAGYAVVVWWQVDENGQPLTLEPNIVEIQDDPDELQRLIDGANAYLAWIDAGRPDTDDDGTPLEVLEAIEAVWRGKEADKVVRAWLDENEGKPQNITSERGSLRYSVTDGDEFDKAAFLAADADAAAVIAEAERLLKDAQTEYRKPKVRSSLTIAPPKEDAA